jgi:DNA-binding NtrC family response regulator
MTKILLNIESKSLLNSLCERLQFENYTTLSLSDLSQAQRVAEMESASVAIVDENSDITTLPPPTIIIAKSPNIDSAIEALRHGAMDYLSLPIDMNRLLETLRSLESNTPTAQPRTTQRHHSRRTNCATQPIIGNSKAIDNVRSMIEREAIELLSNYPWTGNIRELHNVVERLIILSDEQITVDAVRRYYHT